MVIIISKHSNDYFNMIIIYIFVVTSDTSIFIEQIIGSSVFKYHVTV